MKKIKIILVLSLALLLASCSNVDSFLNSLGNLTRKIVDFSGNEYSNGKHNFTIKVPETKYYSAANFELETFYSSNGGKVSVSGQIVSKLKKPFDVRVYVPIYLEDNDVINNILKTYKSEAPHNLVVVDLDEEIQIDRRVFIPKEYVVIGVYFNNVLVGSSHPELLKYNDAKKATSKKVVATKPAVKKATSTTSTASTIVNTKQTKQTKQNLNAEIEPKKTDVKQTRQSATTTTETQNTNTSRKTRQSI